MDPASTTTPDDTYAYLNMPAGRDLDSLIAEQVMNFLWVTWNPWRDPQRHGPRFLLSPNSRDLDTVFVRQRELTPCVDMPTIPPYSTDIAAAWTVLERLEQFDWLPRLARQSPHQRTWVCRLVSFACPEAFVFAEAATVPLAISRAACGVYQRGEIFLAGLRRSRNNVADV